MTRGLPLDIRWMTAFLDRPEATFAAAVAFWQEVTGSALSPPRGDFHEFATLVPPDGDAYLRVQRVESGPGGSHLDLHVDDIGAATAVALDAGAARGPGRDDIAVLRSPAGLLFCIVSHHGEEVRPQPRGHGDAELLLVDQLCVDIPAARYDDECAFWERLTGWRQLRTPATTQFRRLDVPPSMPLRILLQQRRDDNGLAHCHLDIAASARAALASWLEQNTESRAVATYERWIVMVDPAGVEFCVTGRDPRTGASPGGGWRS